MVGFAPIAGVLSDIFECPILLVNFCVIIYLIIYIPMNFIVIKILDMKGLRFTVRFLDFRLNISILVNCWAPFDCDWCLDKKFSLDQ
jgi:hypothetical protein